MAREDAQLKIRLPAELRDRIEAAAAENKRTLNAEVIARLEQTFDGMYDAEKRREITEMVHRAIDERLERSRPDIQLVVRGQKVVLKWDTAAQQYVAAAE